MRMTTAAACTAVLVLGAAIAGAEYEDRTTGDLKAELRTVQRELETFRDYETRLARSERQSSNTARASLIDDLQQHMIDIVLRREDALGVEHTIIRHGQPPTGPTSAAEVGTPMSSVRIPVSPAVIGPMVLPQAISVRTTKDCTGTPSAAASIR